MKYSKLFNLKNWRIKKKFQYFVCYKKLKINSKTKLSNNSSFVILIFAIPNFKNSESLFIFKLQNSGNTLIYPFEKLQKSSNKKIWKICSSENWVFFQITNLL